MKFIAKKDAPDIPHEILEAHERDRLVIFCGAGISYPAGLPGFRGLIEKVYKELNAVSDDLEKEALRNKLYDRAFELLEKRFHSPDRAEQHLVRKQIIEILKIDPSKKLETHEAILELSKTKDGRYRLVSTNFDRGFLIADINTNNYDLAPKLPVPKPHKWASIVHLHGLIDEENDPNGENLVVTSGDFGAAYLTERWASRFVGEIFRNFTVLFIGYSIDDPVIRYMTDAIAADKRKGDEYFTEPYVLARTTTKKQELDEAAWKAKGVTPIFYCNDKKHGYLHKTLREWAAYHRDGLSAKERIIKTKARITPLPPFSENVKQVIDILREKTSENINQAEGYPAKVFSELDPPAPIEWLPVLDSEGLLEIAAIPDKVYLAAQSPETANLKHPNNISRNLWWWLLKHLDTFELVEWVIKRGTGLHHDFKKLVERTLQSNEKPKEPYLTFWHFAVSDLIQFDDREDDFYFRRTSRKKEVTGFWIEFLKDFIRPKAKLSKTYKFPPIDGQEIPRKPFDGDVSISLKASQLHELSQNEDFPNEYISLLLEATNALKGAIELLRILGKADRASDRSYWHMQSVEPHPQDMHRDSWTNLIRLNALLWEAAWDTDRKHAKAVFNLWRTIESPVFKRLVLHAITKKKALSDNQALHFLLQNNDWWLWSQEVRREKFRLLSVLWRRLDKNQSERLIDAVLKGPPREMYRDDLTGVEWTKLLDHSIWLILAKLKSYGKALGARGAKKFRELTGKYPWQLREGERDEFSSWMESRSGYDYDMTVEELLELSNPELITKLKEDSGRFHEGRIDRFKSICKADSKKAVEVLKYLVDEKRWDGSIWQAALMGILDDGEETWDEVAVLIIRCPDRFYKDNLWAVSWWLEKVTKSIEPHSKEEKLFWPIFDKIVKNTKKREKPDINNIVNDAINNPLGMATEALIYRLDKRKLKVDEKINEKKILSRLEKLLKHSGESFILARVILASRLYYFHVVDREWARNNLISLLDFSKTDEAIYIWPGYLRSGDISVELAHDLKDLILDAIDHVNEVIDYTDRLYQIFTLVCLDIKDLHSLAKQQTTLKSIDNKGKDVIASFLSDIVKGEDQEKDDYWKNRIKTFLEKVWPKDADSIDEKISQAFAMLAIKLDESFEDSVDTVFPLIGSFPDSGYFLRKLKDTGLHKSQPKTTLKLLGAVFTENMRYSEDVLNNVIVEMLESNSELREDPRIARMERFLRGKGFKSIG